jgi:2-isopropylmalate synthase
MEETWPSRVWPTRAEPIHNIHLVDCTLREGEQQRGVRFSLEDSIRIARALDQFGVHTIELGAPAASPVLETRARELGKLGLRAQILVHCRCDGEDAKKTLELGLPWMGAYLGLNEAALRFKMKCGVHEALAKATKVVRLAKEAGVRCRLTVEDATRTPWVRLAEAVERALAAGADRISLSDTVGVATPFTIATLIRRIRSAFGAVPLEVHCHNDFGMASANTISALEAGAEAASVSVGGLGERAGIAALEQVAAAVLFLRAGHQIWNPASLRSLVETVYGALGREVPPELPLVGDNAFVHKTGLHVAAALLDPAAYEPIDPEAVGNKRSFLLGRLSGRAALTHHLDRLGLEPDEALVAALLDRIKAMDTDELTMSDLRKLVEEVRE